MSREIKPGVAPHEGSNTTHYSIVDKWGNAVSVTYTLNDWFGAGVMASKTGVILNDEMDDFTSKNRRAEHVRPGAGRSQRHRPPARHRCRP
ncbi:gamma-glutamyltransferase [Pseudomonas lini]